MAKMTERVWMRSQIPVDTSGLILTLNPSVVQNSADPWYSSLMFFAFFLIQDKNMEHDFIKELLMRAALLTFLCQLHPLMSYVILMGMAMGKCTISHSLSHSCIFIHIYEGVIPLNVSVSLSWSILNLSQQKMLLFSKTCHC